MADLPVRLLAWLDRHPAVKLPLLLLGAAVVLFCFAVALRALTGL